MCWSQLRKRYIKWYSLCIHSNVNIHSRRARKHLCLCVCCACVNSTERTGNPNRKTRKLPMKTLACKHKESTGNSEYIVCCCVDVCHVIDLSLIMSSISIRDIRVIIFYCSISYTDSSVTRIFREMPVIVWANRTHLSDWIGHCISFVYTQRIPLCILSVSGYLFTHVHHTCPSLGSWKNPFPSIALDFRIASSLSLYLLRQTGSLNSFILLPQKLFRVRSAFVSEQVHSRFSNKF